MANYAKTNIGNEGRVELHETLSLTGAEISINKLPAGALVKNTHYYFRVSILLANFSSCANATSYFSDIS